MAADLKSGSVTTVEGSAITVSVADGKLMVDQANVVKTNIPASNDVIYGIDTEFIPPKAN